MLYGSTHNIAEGVYTIVLFYYKETSLLAVLVLPIPRIRPCGGLYLVG
jgi:hypothetical protein